MLILLEEPLLVAKRRSVSYPFLFSIGLFGVPFNWSYDALVVTSLLLDLFFSLRGFSI